MIARKIMEGEGLKSGVPLAKVGCVESLFLFLAQIFTWHYWPLLGMAGYSILSQFTL